MDEDEPDEDELRHVVCVYICMYEFVRNELDGRTASCERMCVYMYICMYACMKSLNVP